MVSPSDVRASGSSWWVAVLFGAIAVLVGVDLLTDLAEHTTFAHVLLELLVVAIGFAAATTITLRLRRSNRVAQELRAHADQLTSDLNASRAEAARFREDAASLIQGLSSAIDDQFTRWELSPAEREIALLLLKGLSHKEIAEVRSVSETTVRQQARSLYKKAGLGGRADLAAFFLEDLLGPREATARSSSA